jgi:hypothetical protein
MTTSNPFGAPGRLRPEHQGDVFTIYAHLYGCLEIVRREDGASLFVQSQDDLIVLRRDLARAERARDWERAIDDVCGEYAHVMSSRGWGMIEA